MSITDATKGNFQRLYEHYFHFLSETKLTFGQNSLQTFIDQACEKYHPDEARKTLWFNAKDWLLMCHAENAEKYKQASVSWDWFWLFPLYRISKDPRANVQRRHHVCNSSLRKAIQLAKRKLKFSLKVSPHPHTFRHCFATHMLEGASLFIRCKN